MLNGVGDLIDLLHVLAPELRPDWSRMTKDEVIAQVRTISRNPEGCSRGLLSYFNGEQGGSIFGPVYRETKSPLRWGYPGSWDSLTLTHLLFNFAMDNSHTRDDFDQRTHAAL